MKNVKNLHAGDAIPPGAHLVGQRPTPRMAIENTIKMFEDKIKMLRALKDELPEMSIDAETALLHIMTGQ